MPDKTGGVVLMALSLVAVVQQGAFGLATRSREASVFFLNFIILGWLGGCPAEEPYVSLSQQHTAIYFAIMLF
jgi:hypothetical protein